MDLSIIIPIHNEECRLDTCIEQILRYAKDKPDIEIEVLLIENGSTDNTLDMAYTYMGAHPDLVRVYNLSERGKGAAVRDGMLAAQGDYAMMADCDWSMPVEYIDAFWQLRNPNQILIGDRSNSKSLVYQSLTRRIASFGINLLVQMIALPGIWDTQCGYKLFPAKIARELFSRQTLDNIAFDVEILSIARKLGYQICSIPIIWFSDSYSVIRISDGWEMLKSLLKITRNTRGVALGNIFNIFLIVFFLIIIAIGCGSVFFSALIIDPTWLGWF